MTEYSRMVKGYYTVTGGVLGVSAPNAKIIALPFTPDFFELRNLTQQATPATHSIPYAWWDANVTVTSTTVRDTFVQVNSSATAITYDSVVVGGGISTFTAGNIMQLGARKQVVSITKANPAVVTVTAHGLSSGDVVVFQGLNQSATTGMPLLEQIHFTVTVVDANSFTIPWNTNQSEYTALSGSPSGAYMRKVLYPYLYAPGQCVISGITLGTTTTIDTASAHNFVVGQEVAFRIPNDFGTVELNSLPNSTTPGSPIYGYVIAVTDYNTFVVNINSSNYSAFTNNVAFNEVPGTSFPQVVAVGDVNTGGVQISSGSVLYPHPYTVPIGTSRVNTINGPAIQGSFINNSQQGFIVGVGASVNDTSSWVGGSAGDIMEFRAYLHDATIPA